MISELWTRPGLTDLLLGRLSAPPLTMVHYSKAKLKVIRPLTYWELYQYRKGAMQKLWKDQEAFRYLVHRISFESECRVHLEKLGYERNEELSWLYCTLAEHEGESFQRQMGNWRHEVPLTPKRIERSFFEVVGLPMELRARRVEEMAGADGLKRALLLWTTRQSIIKPHKFMKMTIIPRIEVITPDPFVPTKVVDLRNRERLRGPCRSW